MSLVSVPRYIGPRYAASSSDSLNSSGEDYLALEVARIQGAFNNLLIQLPTSPSSPIANCNQTQSDVREDKAILSENVEVSEKDLQEPLQGPGDGSSEAHVLKIVRESDSNTPANTPIPYLFADVLVPILQSVDVTEYPKLKRVNHRWKACIELIEHDLRKDLLKYLIKHKAVSPKRAKCHSLKKALSSIHSINLKNRGIEELPKQLYLLPNLRYLDVSSNTITSLDKSFALCKHLVCINASNNNFKSFPAVLSTMKSLRTIDLRRNCIAGVPMLSRKVRLLTG